MSLKDLMGAAYKPDLQVADIEAFFEGNDKIVNLSNGGYVAKGKFDEVNSKYKELSEGTKDYNDIKTKYDELVATNKKNEALGVIGKYVKDEFKDYAYYQMKVNNKLDDKLEDNIKELVKTNKQFAVGEPEPKKDPVVVDTFAKLDGGGANKNAHDAFNQAIREAAGH